jgi:Ni,Fe-hydrogenase III small subunit
MPAAVQPNLLPVDQLKTERMQRGLIIGCSIALVLSVALVAVGALAISSHTLPLKSDLMFKVKVLTIFAAQSISQTATAIPAIIIAVGACGAIASIAGLARAKHYKVSLQEAP